VDYYFVRRGAYDIEQIFDSNGIYRRYRWRTTGLYVFSILIQIPFMNLSFYTGSFARAIGVDVAWIPGTLVPAILYGFIERRAPREE
jgi:NCS1 family nucleobase:cation symporter-1